jgi:aryl-alcohol dehydrogenase-like predicted oxidoreductase
MEYTVLGKTELAVSVMAMGCWALARDRFWGAQDEAESVSTVHAALDAGVTFFDTAEAYGDGGSELVLGRALAGIRHDVVIATKASPDHLAGRDLVGACERSLKRLGTDYIDLYQIHWPNHRIPQTESWQALEKLQAQGKVRAVGVSNFGAEDLADALDVGRCETNQLPYNLVWRAIEYESLPACIERDVGILCYSPLAQGLLTGKFTSPQQVPEGRARSRYFSSERSMARHGEPGCEVDLFSALEEIRRICKGIHRPMAEVSLAWLLHQPGVLAVIVGARSPEQMRKNVQSVELELSPDVIEELGSVTEQLKTVLGSNPDMWQSESRYR